MAKVLKEIEPLSLEEILDTINNSVANKKLTFRRTDRIHKKVKDILKTEYSQSLSIEERESLLLASKLVQVDLLLPTVKDPYRLNNYTKYEIVKPLTNELVSNLILFNELFINEVIHRIKHPSKSEVVNNEIYSTVNENKNFFLASFNRKKCLNILTYASLLTSSNGIYTTVDILQGQLKPIWNVPMRLYHHNMQILRNIESHIFNPDSVKKDLLIIDTTMDNVTTANQKRVSLINKYIAENEYEDIYILNRRFNSDGCKNKHSMAVSLSAERSTHKLRYESSISDMFNFKNEVEIITIALDQNLDTVTDLYFQAVGARVLTRLCDVSSLQENRNNYTVIFEK